MEDHAFKGPFAPARDREVLSDYDDVLVALRRIIRATDLHSKRLSKTTGLTGPQLLILQSIRRSGPIAIGAVARNVNLSQATVTTILDRLEKRGLVRRVRSEQDKRRVNVSLTADGRRVIDGSPTPLQANFVERFKALEDWERGLIIAALQRVAQMMDAEDIDASPYLDIGAIDRNEGNE